MGILYGANHLFKTCARGRRSALHESELVGLWASKHAIPWSFKAQRMLPKSYGRPFAHRVFCSALWIPIVSSPHSRRTFSFTARPRLPAPFTGAAVNELRPAPGSAVNPLKELAAVSPGPLSVPRPRIPRRNFSPISLASSVSFSVTCECSTRMSSAIDGALPMM